VLIVALAAFLSSSVQDPPPGFWERDRLSGTWGGTRDDLEQEGVTVSFAFTGEVFSCVSGGLRRDTRIGTLLDLGLDADFEKLLGWTGALMHFNPLWLAGDDITDAVDGFTHVSNIEGLGDVRVFEVWLEQALWSRAFSVRAGILAADQEFAVNPAGSVFCSSAFGAPVILTANLSWPIYPVGALGVRLRANLSEALYVQAGVYDGNPGSEGHNRSGLQVHWSHTEGTFAIAEARWTSANEHPSILKAGVFHHSAEFPNYGNGGSAAGLTGAYALYVQRLWNPETMPGKLDAYIRPGISQADRSVLPFVMDTGFSWTGLIPGRSADVFGVAWVYGRVGSDFASSVSPGPSGSESVIETTYRFFVTPAWSLQPDLQYVIHPGGGVGIPNATVVGLRMILHF
jgi:porin